MNETSILEAYRQGDADARLALSMAYRDLRRDFGVIDLESPVPAKRKTPWLLCGIPGREGLKN